MKRTVLMAAVVSVALPIVLLIGCSSAKTPLGYAAPFQQSASATDVAVTNQVKIALAADGELSASKIAVNTMAGTVTLKGEIKSMILRKKVDAIVNGVTGVKAVENRLVITG